MKRILLGLLGFWLSLVPAFATVQSLVMRDANLTVPPAAYAVTTINTFSAPRVLTLPSAASTNIGNSGAITYYQNALVFYDGANAITGSNTLTITAASGETINGASTLVVNIQGAIVTMAPINGSAWAASVSGPGTAVVPPTTCSANQWISAIAATGAGTCSATGTVVAIGKTATFSNTLTFTGTDASSIAFGAGGTIGSTGYAVTGQIPGTTTNDDATAGKIGEYLNSTVLSASAVPLTSTVYADITTLAITAGDWNVSGQVCTAVAGGTTTSMVEFGVNSSAALPTRGINQSYLSNGAVGANNASCGSIGPFRLSLSGTTTYHLGANATFATGTQTGYGILQARRVR